MYSSTTLIEKIIKFKRMILYQYPEGSALLDY